MKGQSKETLKTATVKIGAVTAFGAAMYGSVLAIDQYVSFSRAEHNTYVSACAKKLGEVAATQTVLPSQCEDFHKLFASKHTTTYLYDPKSGTQRKVEDVTVYDLPSAREFKESHLMSKEEAQRRDKATQYLAVGSGAISAIGLGVALLRIPRRENSSQ